MSEASEADCNINSSTIQRGDAEGDGSLPRVKSDKELQKEKKRLEKLEKFKAKQEKKEKEAAEKVNKEGKVIFSGNCKWG